MTKLLEYRGHIRNYRELCEELGLDKNLSREERENQIEERSLSSLRV